MKTQILNCIKEIIDINDYAIKVDRDELYHQIIEKTVRVEYSKGGVTSIFGIYPIEPFEEKNCINYTKGRKIKGIPKKFNFKYYFDKDDNILMWEKYLDGIFRNRHIALYKNNIKIIISFHNYNFEDKTVDIYSIYKCEYDDENRIIRYLRSYGHNHNGIISMVNEILYEYSENEAYVTTNIYSLPSEESLKYFGNKILGKSLSIDYDKQRWEVRSEKFRMTKNNAYFISEVKMEI